MNSIQKFIELLKNSPQRHDVFNPWWQVDPENDIDKNGPKIRREQFAQYLKERQGLAKYLVLGEALGYQGGHFTGMAMTSERILLGGQSKNGIEPHHVFQNLKPRRTSKPEVKTLGFNEPTATMAWGFMLSNNFSPTEFVIWNAYPWHPFDPKKGYLSNRTPKPDEFHLGKKILVQLIETMNLKHIIAVGEKAYTVLTEEGIDCHKVRHPANGGATKFRDQMKQYIVGIEKKR